MSSTSQKISEGLLLDAKAKKYAENYDLALKSYQKIEKLYTLSSDLEIKELAQIWSDQGEIYVKLQEFDKAFDYYSKSLEILSDVYGSENQLVSNTYFNLGQVLQKMKRYEESIILLNKALSINKILSKSDDSLLGNDYFAIGQVYQEMNQLAEAEDYYGRALNSFLQNYDSESHNIAKSYLKLGLCKYTKQKYFESIDACQNGLKLYSNQELKKDSIYCLTILSIGKAHIQLANFEIALQYMIEALPIFIKIYGSNHQNTGKIYDFLGNIYFQKREYFQALKYCQQGVAILQENQYETNDLAIALSNFGRILYKIGDLDRSFEALSYSLQLSMNQKYFSNELASTAYSYLGEIYALRGDYEKATECHEAALEHIEDKREESYENNFRVYFNLGSFYAGFNEEEKALQYFQQALKIKLSISEENAEDIISILSEMGNLLSVSNKERAVDCYSRAFEIAKKFYSIGSSEITELSSKLRKLFESMPQKEESNNNKEKMDEKVNFDAFSATRQTFGE